MALGFFSRLKEGLTRSTQKLTEGITGSPPSSRSGGWTMRRWRNWRMC